MYFLPADFSSSYLDSFNDSLELVERADENTAPKPSASTPQTVVIDREVDLFVIVGTSNETGKPGRIMTLLRVSDITFLLVCVWELVAFKHVLV